MDELVINAELEKKNCISDTQIITQIIKAQLLDCNPNILSEKIISNVEKIINDPFNRAYINMSASAECNILDIVLSSLKHYISYPLSTCFPSLSCKQIYNSIPMNVSFFLNDPQLNTYPYLMLTPPPYYSPIFKQSNITSNGIKLSNHSQSTFLIKDAGKYFILPKIKSITWNANVPNITYVIGLYVNLYMDIDNTEPRHFIYAISTIEIILTYDGSQSTTNGLAYNPPFIYQMSQYNKSSFLPIPLKENTNISFSIQFGSSFEFEFGVPQPIDPTNIMNITIDSLELEFIKVS